MIAKITAKGQIALPKMIRERCNLKVEDELEFDESTSTLTARRVVNREQLDAIGEWQDASCDALAGHPWGEKSSDELINDIRSGVADA